MSVTLAAPPNSKMSMCGSLLQESWRLHSLEPLIQYKWKRIVQLTHLSTMLSLPRHHQQCVYLCSYRQGEENTCTHTHVHMHTTHTQTHKYAYMHAFMHFCQIYSTHRPAVILERLHGTIEKKRHFQAVCLYRHSGVLEGYCGAR